VLRRVFVQFCFFEKRDVHLGSTCHCPSLMTAEKIDGAHEPEHTLLLLKEHAGHYTRSNSSRITRITVSLYYLTLPVSFFREGVEEEEATAA